MRQYIIRRLIYSVPTVLLVSLFTFSLIRIIPGDVIVAQIEDIGALTAEDRAYIEHELGLDRGFVVSYFSWLGGAARFDFGDSLWTGSDVATEIRRTLPVTLELNILSIIIGLSIALPVGVFAAIRQDTIPDYIARFFAILGLSIPNFWLATMAILYLSIWFGWVPPLLYKSPFEDPGSNFMQYLLPAVINGTSSAATTMRMTRSSLLEVLRQDYIRTAWAKGLRERAVVTRHALKNAFIPVITIFGSRIGHIVAGSVITESIFGLPGMGFLLLDSIIHRDYPMIQALIMLITFFILAANLVVDISYAWFDPRIRFT